MNKNLIESLRLIVLKDSEDLMNRYERELFSADEKRKADKKRIEEENTPKIKELKAKVKELSAWIKTVSAEEKAKTGQEIKLLNEEISSLQQPVTNHFTVLGGEAKGYACSIFLLKELVKEETLKEAGIPYEIDEKYKITVDYEALRDSELGSRILETSDYITDRVRGLGTKITNPGEAKNILASDFNKYNIQNNEEDKKTNITFEKILESKRLYDEEQAEIANKNKDLQTKIAESKKGINVLKEYPSGNIIVELLPSEFVDKDGKKHHASITFESDEMGHCVGRGGYDNVIGKEGYHFYSLRSYNKDGVFEPHCTISIEAGQLRQIKGKSNLSVKNKYVRDVRDFVNSLNMEIPASEKALIGYIKDADNKDIDLYNLESETRLRKINLSSGDGKYIDFSKITGIEEVVFEDLPSVSDFKELSAIGNIGRLSLSKLGTKKGTKRLFDLFKLEDLPNTENGITANDYGDASSYPADELLRKIYGYKHVEKTADSVVFKGNLDLSSSQIIFPKSVKKVRVEGDLTTRFDFPIDTLPKHKGKLVITGDSDNKADFLREKVGYLRNGVECQSWGDLSGLPLKEVLSKIQGTDWFEKYVSEENGRMVVDTDLDLAKHGITGLSSEFKDVIINGKLKVKEMDLSNVPATKESMEYAGMIFGHNLPLQEFLLKLKGSKWADENLIIKNNKLSAIKGDLDLSNYSIKTLNEDLYSVKIGGVFKCGYYLSLARFPNAKILNIDSKVIRNREVPDSVEKIVSHSQRDLRLKGKNLKEFEIEGEYMQINPEDMQQLSPDILYKGDYVAVNHSHYGETRDLNFTIEHVDISKIKIDGKFKIAGDVSSLKWCPEADFIDTRSCTSLTNESLEDLNPNIKKLDISHTKIDSLDYLPENTGLKEVIKRDSSDGIEFLKNIKRYDIEYDLRLHDIKRLFSGLYNEESYSDYEEKKDYSLIKLKELDIECGEPEIYLKDLPQAKSFSIRHDLPENDSFKDLSPYTENLSLSYMHETDLSSIPADSRLKKIDLHDMNYLNRDSLQYLPESIEEINLFECSILDLSKIEMLPNLKVIEISRNTYPADALNKISPEKLKQVALDSSYYNYNLMNRRNEIITIYDAPSNEVNDKLKQMNEWLCKDDDKRAYLYRQLAFYKLGSDIIDGKYKGGINDDILNKSADKFKDTMLKSCSELIMANEINAKEGNETSGRRVVEMLKDRKAGYYKKSGSSNRSNLDLIKAIVTRKIEKHPNFFSAESRVMERMENFNIKMQASFNEKLLQISNKEQKIYTPPNKLKSTSLNAYVKEHGRYL